MAVASDAQPAIPDPRPLRPYVAAVEAPSCVGVAGPLDDRSAVPEDRQLVAVDEQPHKMRVLLNLADRGQALGQPAQLHPISPRRSDLHGIASTERLSSASGRRL